MTGTDYYYRLERDGSVTRTTDRDSIQSAEERRVDATTVAEGVEVSTVFLWIDHAWGGGPPLLFESLIFGGDHDGWMDRYHTIGEARLGHERIVENLRNGREPDATEEAS